MVSAPPTVSASFNKSGYAPGELMVLTIEHNDVDRQVIAVSGELVGSDGASGSWSATAVIDDGTVQWTQMAGKTWTLQSATLNRSVFTATA